MGGPRITEDEILEALEQYGPDTGVGLAARLQRDEKVLMRRLQWMAVCGCLNRSGAGRRNDPFVYSSPDDPYGRL